MDCSPWQWSLGMFSPNFLHVYGPKTQGFSVISCTLGKFIMNHQIMNCQLEGSRVELMKFTCQRFNYLCFCSCIFCINQRLPVDLHHLHIWKATNPCLSFLTCVQAHGQFPAQKALCHGLCEQLYVHLTPSRSIAAVWSWPKAFGNVRGPRGQSQTLTEMSNAFYGQ